MMRFQHSNTQDDPLTIKAKEKVVQFKGNQGTAVVEGVTYNYSAIEFFEGAERRYLATIDCNGRIANGKASSLISAYAQAFKTFIN